MELLVDFREKTRILYWQHRFCYHGKQLTGKESPSTGFGSRLSELYRGGWTSLMRGISTVRTTAPKNHGNTDFCTGRFFHELLEGKLKIYKLH